MNRYDRYPGDYLRQTLALTPAQDGMYGRLMDYYYSTEKAIPEDEVESVTRCRNDEDKGITQWVLRRFFELTPMGWYHARIEEEIAKAQPRIEAARINGLKGGRPRKKPNGLASGKPNGEPNDNPGRKLPSPSPSPSIEQDQKPIAQRAARFEDFWAIYPCKKGRADAEKKWKARNLDQMADRIIADVKARIAKDRQWIDGYIPHGSTYVNGRGWEDAIESGRPGNGGSSGYVPLPGEN